MANNEDAPRKVSQLTFMLPIDGKRSVTRSNVDDRNATREVLMNDLKNAGLRKS